MAVVPIISQSWDTTSYVNPTRMNNIETNIATVSNATGVKYAEGVSVKDKIDSVEQNKMKLLTQIVWDYTAKDFTFQSSNPCFIYGARAGKGILAIMPVNNGEICIVKNDFGGAIYHITSDLYNHTLRFGVPTTSQGSNCILAVFSY